MNLTNLRPVGQELLEDTEGFISDLSEEEMLIQGAFFQAPKSYSASASISQSDNPYPALISSVSSAPYSYSNSASSGSFGQSGSLSSYPMTAPMSQSSVSQPVPSSSADYYVGSNQGSYPVLGM
ncbi:hypothetical protein [[Phormidium] sp. ETS-05]|uniref:hypothetical protein n=1 Tax=[Phormidium] sp. ETS-05 TaxID=222819 RepID=UPI0018EEDA79|nr:hypothetical protein [[Phormidium] sp. ETS-05]